MVVVALASPNVYVSPDLYSATKGMIGADSYVKGANMFLEERSEEHTSELQSLMRISYAVFCLKKKKIIKINQNSHKYSVVILTSNNILHRHYTDHFTIY